MERQRIQNWSLRDATYKTNSCITNPVMHILCLKFSLNVREQWVGYRRRGRGLRFSGDSLCLAVYGLNLLVIFHKGEAGAVGGAV